MSEKNKGFGDTIASITKAIGIQPCESCKDRQLKLNELFPYYSNITLLNKEDYEFMEYIIDIKNRNGDLSSSDLKRLYALYNSTFNTKVQECFSCVGYVKKIIDKLEKVKNNSGYED